MVSNTEPGSSSRVVQDGEDIVPRLGIDEEVHRLSEVSGAAMGLGRETAGVVRLRLAQQPSKGRMP